MEAWKYSGVKMSDKKLSPVKNKIKTVISLVIGIIFSISVPQLIAAEDKVSAAKGETKVEEGDKGVGESSVNPSTVTRPRNTPNNFLKGSAATGGPNSSGIIQSTSFSKEAGFLRQVQSPEQVGLSNRIVLTSSVAHDSNPSFDDNRKSPVTMYSLIPNLLVDYTGEINNLYLDASLIVQRNSNEDVFPDRDDPNLALGWSRTYASGIYGVYARYSQFVSRIAEITTTGEFAGNLDGESTQRERVFGGRWQHTIAPRWNVLTTGEYIKTAFSGGVNQVDFGLVDLRSRLNYNFTERLDTYVLAGYTKIAPDSVLEDAKLSRVALGADYLISDALTGSLRAGQYRVSGAQSESDWEAGVRLAYDTGRMLYTAELNREVGSAGGVGGFQKLDGLVLGWVYAISEKDNLTANYSLIKIKENQQFLTPKSQFEDITVGYNRILGSNWRAVALMSYRENKVDTQTQALFGSIALTYDGLSF